MNMPAQGLARGRPGTWWPNPERAERFPGCDLSRLSRRDAVPGAKVSVVSGGVHFVSAFWEGEFGMVSGAAERRLD